MLYKCSRCKDEKPFECFYVKKNRKRGCDHYCKDCRKIIRREHYENNKEKELKQAYDLRVKKTKIIKKQKAQYYIDNKEKINIRNRKWISNNRDIMNAHKATYEAKKLKATPPWLNEIHHMQIQWYYAAAKMMSDTTGILHHIDHIHPLQGKNFSGLHAPWNLQAIKAAENLSKGNNLPSELSHLMWEQA